MACMNPRLLLLASAMLSAACATSREGEGWSAQPTRVVPAEHRMLAMTMRVALPLPVESPDGPVGREQLQADGRSDEPAVPDIAGRWMGVWSGFGVRARRMSTAQAEFTQAGRWGWGTIVLADTLAADVPAVVTYRGALGVPVVFDVFPALVVVKHEAGGGHLTAVFRIDGDRMVGALRGHDTLIVLSRLR